MRTEQHKIEDLEKLKDSNSWPHWPVLPVKRSSPLGHVPEVGVVVDGENPAKVFLVNMYNKEQMSRLNLAKVKEYESFEAMLEDGWEID